MDLNNVLTTLKRDLNHIGETLILAKEPNEQDADIDTFITNRSSRSSTYLCHSCSIPLIFTHKIRGFAYYLSKEGLIKPIDLYDAPFISDQSIQWFLSRAKASQFNAEIKILSQEDQAAHLIYKALKKKKFKRARYEKIRKLTEGMNTEQLQDALMTLCQKQNERGGFTRRALHVVQLIYSSEVTDERFASLTTLPIEPSRSMSIRKIGERIKRAHALFKNQLFFLKTPRRKAPFICCIGIDGAGKSTTVEALASSMEKLACFNARLETKVLHHPLTRGYINKLRPLFDVGKAIFDRLHLSGAAQRMEHIKTWMNLRFIYFDTKAKIKALIKMTKKSRLVIVDRWWLDFFVAPKNEPHVQAYPTVLNAFLSLPQPDLLILIEAPLSVSLKRRPDENPKTLLYKKEHLSSFANQHFSDRLFVIQGDDELEGNIKTIHHQLYHVWCEMLSNCMKDRGQ